MLGFARRDQAACAGKTVVFVSGVGRGVFRSIKVGLGPRLLGRMVACVDRLGGLTGATALSCIRH